MSFWIYRFKLRLENNTEVIPVVTVLQRALSQVVLVTDLSMIVFRPAF